MARYPKFLKFVGVKVGVSNFFWSIDKYWWD